MVRSIVIKLGGSLLQSPELLANCLDKIERDYCKQAVIIVPGGGVFADQVRLAQKQWLFDDRTAHCMAVLAMQQVALLIAGLKKEFVVVNSREVIKQVVCVGRVLIWSPTIIDLDNDEISSTWDITSDTLAMWLAKSVLAEQLILVKSASINPALSFQELAQQGIVDKAFCDFVMNAAVKIAIINAQNL